MKFSIIFLLLSIIVHAAPIGICLHSYSPEAPNDKIESIEFEKIEKDQQGTWVYPANQRAVLITKYRYRGTIAYVDKMTPDHPEFKRYLKYYEDNATQIPSTRRFLNPKIIAMRELASAYDKQKAEYEKLPQITIGGKNYRNPKLIKFEGGNMYISHKDGNAKFHVDSLSDKEIELFRSTDPSFASFTTLSIGERRLWNPRFDGIKNGSIQIAHENGVEQFDLETIAEKDIDIIKKMDPSFKNNTTEIISGRKLWNPKFDGIKNGLIQISHEKGIAQFDLETIAQKDIDIIKKFDPSFKTITIETISGRRLWNPKWKGIKNGQIEIHHEKGDLLIPIDKLSLQDEKIISSWSDGTWKIKNPGFYEYSEDQKVYKELVLENGKFHKNIALLSRDGNEIIFQSQGGKISFSIQQVVKISGISSEDQKRIQTWVDEIVDERFAEARPKEEMEVVSKSLLPDGDLVVKDVAVKILQVLDQGVLASAFVGDLQKGTMVVRIEKKKIISHPITGERLNKTVESKTETRQIVERITDDLCYIVGNTSDLVDGEIVKAKSMRLRGRYQYIDVRGVQRSVRKYQVD